MDLELEVGNGAREMVDLQAEAVSHLGHHLVDIGTIIAKGTMPPPKGERGTAFKLKPRSVKYEAYCDEYQRRQAELQEKMAEDYRRLTEWRKQAGTEGANLVEQLERLFDETRDLKKTLEHEKLLLWEEQQRNQLLVASGESKDRKWAALAENFIRKRDNAKRDTRLRAGLCSWVEVVFSDVRFKFKAHEERGKLNIEHMKKMRTARAQARIDVTQRTRGARLLQACVLAFQEECVEQRSFRHLQMLRKECDDALLVANGQLAQAIGDEEAAADLVAEQQRRIEEAREQTREMEAKMKDAQKDARIAREEAGRCAHEAQIARKAEAAALERADVAEAEARASNQRAVEAAVRADESDQARFAAELAQRDAEDQVRKNRKKMASMQRMLAELGAESDSDAPPDERMPAFFVNEDGTRQPRERTRKERMAMAYREAESARLELRLGMAAMLDKDVNAAAELSHLRTALAISEKQVETLRAANNQLALEVDAFAAAAAEAAAAKEQRQADDVDEAAATRKQQQLKVPARPPPSPGTLATMGKLALSPQFAKVFGTSSPLLKTASQPVLGGLVPVPSPQTGKLSLAPLRRGGRPHIEWKVGWH